MGGSWLCSKESSIIHGRAERGVSDYSNYSRRTLSYHPGSKNIKSRCPVTSPRFGRRSGSEGGHHTALLNLCACALGHRHGHMPGSGEGTCTCYLSSGEYPHSYGGKGSAINLGTQCPLPLDTQVSPEQLNPSPLSVGGPPLSRMSPATSIPAQYVLKPSLPGTPQQGNSFPSQCLSGLGPICL